VGVIGAVVHAATIKPIDSAARENRIERNMLRAIGVMMGKA
jgi:hypothetical protein